MMAFNLSFCMRILEVIKVTFYPVREDIFLHLLYLYLLDNQHFLPHII